MRRFALCLAAIPLALANLGAHCSGAPSYRPYAQGQSPCTVPGFKPSCPQSTRLEVRHQGRACEIACRNSARRYHGPYARLYRYASKRTQIEIGAYRLGRRHGVFRTTRVIARYKRSERVVEERSYRRGTLHGATRQLRDGLLVSVTTYRFGVLDGRQANWTYPSGQLSHSHHYRHGRLHGAWKQRRGNVMIEGRYKDGLPDGRFTVTSASGKRVGAFSFNDGVGTWRRFLLDGTVVESRAMRFGLKHGPYRTFHPTGKPQQIGSYHRNQRDGLWCTFNVGGQLTHSELRRNGNLVRRSNTRGASVDSAVLRDQKACVRLYAQLQQQRQRRAPSSRSAAAKSPRPAQSVKSAP